MQRFYDEGKYPGDFRHYHLVKCPKCAAPVNLTSQLSCTNCGYSKTKDESASGLKYFLVAPCCGHTFRAYNLDHLDFIERYVAADLRVREPNINKSQVSRLPQWMKSAKNREEILKCIRKLRNQLKVSDYQRPSDS